MEWIWNNWGRLFGDITAITSITTVILFIVYFRLNKRQKESEVRQSEANVKQQEGSALTTMQAGYATFTRDMNERYDSLRSELNALEESNRAIKYEFAQIKRSNAGLTREVGILKKSLFETEKIACLRLDCMERIPKLGEYKHKRDDDKSA